MNYFLLGACLVVALAGCKQDVVTPTATTSTGSTGTSTSGQAITFASSEWRFWVSNWVSNGVGNGSQENPNQYQSSLTTSVSNTTSTGTSVGGIPVITRSESYSLGVSALTIKDTSSYSYWTAALTPPKALIPGKLLTLKAKIQLQGMQGKGVSIALRGDRNVQSGVLFATTQGKISLTGTSDLAEYSVTLPYSTSVDYILVYLVVLPQTTGKVIFRNVSLQVN